MKPVLFTIGSYNVYAFGVFLALAFIISTIIVWWFGREDLKEEQYLDAYVACSLVGLVGARVSYIISHHTEFGFSILRIILVRETPGLSLIGGFVTGSMFLYFYCRNYKLSFSRLSDIFTTALSLALIFVKTGQLLGGAAMGRITESIFAVRVVGLVGRRHPVEFYEAFLYLIQFIILLILARKATRRKWPQFTVSLLFVIFTAVNIFVLEFFKEYNIYLYGLSLKQLLTLGSGLVVCCILLVRFKIPIKLLNKFKKKP